MSAPGLVEWTVVPSALDQVESPSLSIVGANCPENEVRLVMSDWLSGQSLRQFSITFDRPLVVVATEEMLFSVAGPGSDTPSTGPKRLCETASSPLLERYGRWAEDSLRMKPRHFLIAGLNTCWEVVAERPPSIEAHATFAAAMRSGLAHA
jgi:hypothetical protein